MISSLFREARPRPRAWNVTKTILQIVVVWSMYFGLFPAIVNYIERSAGLPSIAFPGREIAGWMLFALASLFALICGIVIALDGEGTPLPLDSSRRLVIRGPYRYIRNPMAVCGVVQFMGVGLVSGSPLTLVCALIGGLIWQFVLRPAEEEDMLKRFGVEYKLYRASVRCWIPGRRYDR